MEKKELLDLLDYCKEREESFEMQYRLANHNGYTNEEALCLVKILTYLDIIEKINDLLKEE